MGEGFCVIATGNFPSDADVEIYRYAKNECGVSFAVAKDGI